MKRLIEAIVRVGLVTAWRLAGAPTSFAPSGWKATTEGVVRPPSALGITTGWPPSITLTTELVVPRSIPMILLWLLMGVWARPIQVLCQCLLVTQAYCQQELVDKSAGANVAEPWPVCRSGRVRARTA